MRIVKESRAGAYLSQPEVGKVKAIVLMASDAAYLSAEIDGKQYWSFDPNEGQLINTAGELSLEPQIIGVKYAFTLGSFNSDQEEQGLTLRSEKIGSVVFINKDNTAYIFRSADKWLEIQPMFGLTIPKEENTVVSGVITANFKCFAYQKAMYLPYEEFGNIFPSPINLVVQPNQGWMQLSWTNRWVDAISIEVFRNDSLIATLPASAVTYQDASIDDVSTYTYKVRAKANDLVTSFSNTANGVSIPFNYLFNTIKAGSFNIVLTKTDGVARWKVNGAEYNNQLFATDSLAITFADSQAKTIKLWLNSPHHLQGITANDDALVNDLDLSATGYTNFTSLSINDNFCDLIPGDWVRRNGVSIQMLNTVITAERLTTLIDRLIIANGGTTTDNGSSYTGSPGASHSGRVLNVGNIVVDISAFTILQQKITALQSVGWTITTAFFPLLEASIGSSGVISPSTQQTTGTSLFVVIRGGVPLPLFVAGAVQPGDVLRMFHTSQNNITRITLQACRLQELTVFAALMSLSAQPLFLDIKNNALVSVVGLNATGINRNTVRLDLTNGFADESARNAFLTALDAFGGTNTRQLYVSGAIDADTYNSVDVYYSLIRALRSKGWTSDLLVMNPRLTYNLGL